MIKEYNINKEFYEFKKEYDLLLKHIKAKDNELIKIKSLMHQDKIRKNSLIPIPVDEIQISKNNDKPEEKNNYLSDLNKKLRFIQEKEDFERIITNLKKKKEKLLEEIKQIKGKNSSMKNISNSSDNLNKEINKLKDELKHKNEQIENIKKIFENEKNVLTKQNNDKDNEIKKLREVNSIMKKNELNLNIIKNKEIEINKRIEELYSIENNLNNLNEKYKELEEMKKNLEKEISNLSKIKGHKAIT